LGIIAVPLPKSTLDLSAYSQINPSNLNCRVFTDTIGLFVGQLGRLPMLWFVIRQSLSTALECVWLWRKTDREKDLEILLLRRQLAIVDRARDKPWRVSPAEKLRLAGLAAQLKSVTGWPVKQFGNVLRIFQPETVFK
jgi:hypothetical protein